MRFLTALMLCFSLSVMADDLVVENGSLRDLTDWITETEGHSFIYQEGVNKTINLNIQNVETFEPMDLLRGVLSSTGLKLTLMNGFYLISEDRIAEADQTNPSAQEVQPYDYALSTKVYKVHSTNTQEVYKALSVLLPSLKQRESIRLARELPDFTVVASDTAASLSVTVAPDLHPDIEAFINQLNVVQTQVLVEAVIYETSNLDHQALGFNFRDFSIGDGLTVDFGIKKDVAFAVPGLGLSYSNGSSIKALINALNSTDETRVLSTPSVRIVNRQRARMDVGQEVPFITTQQTNDNGQTVNTIERKTVGLSLDVLPVIDGDTVQLTVKTTAGSISPSTGAADIITNNRTLNTTVNTRNGETVYLGGLITDDLTIQQMGFPVLKDLPVIGHVFNNKTEISNKRKLSIFIKTTLI